MIGAALVALIFAFGLFYIVRNAWTKRLDEGLLPGLGPWRNDTVIAPFLIVGDEVSDDLVNAFHQAGYWWNDELGVRVFTEDLEGSGIVIPLVRTELDGNKAMQVQHYINDAGLTHSASIRVDPKKLRGLLHENRVRSAKHELGHLLRLAHDNDPLSVMYPTVMQGSVVEVHVTDADKWLIKEELRLV